MGAAPSLTTTDLDDLVAFRRDLHRHPELSGREALTAAAVVELLSATQPDEIVTGIGGHGVAVVYHGAEPGPTLLLRAELDALPIHEVSELPYRSQNAGVGHHCGHDGHMAIFGGVGRALGRQRPTRGRTVLMFQPAEENGTGATAVLADPAFEALRPDLCVAMHNLSWLPLGTVAIREGHLNCASRGLRIALTGRTSHASAPEDGVSPSAAVASLLTDLPSLSSPTPDLDERFRLVTVTHARLGDEAGGVTPGDAEVWATLRTLTDEQMGALRTRADSLAEDLARTHGLALAIDEHSVFHHCVNHPEAVALVRRALGAQGVPHELGPVQRASEDFGLFGGVAPSAMFFMGSGRAADSPQMHNPDFDFPDELIAQGVRIFLSIIGEFGNQPSPSPVQEAS